MKFIVRVLALVLFFAAVSQLRRATQKRARILSLVVIIASALILVSAVLEWIFPEDWR